MKYQSNKIFMFNTKKFKLKIYIIKLYNYIYFYFN